MAMLNMLKAGHGQGTIKGAPYMTMEKCISIDTSPDKITQIHEAYAKKVITKP